MKTLKSLAALLALLAAAAPALGSTTLPLNTGYDYGIWGLYPAPGPATLTPAPTATMDMYWINIATYPTTNPAVGPAFVVQPSPAWAVLPNSYWVSARNTFFSGAGTGPSRPGYSIFRKCFCLSEGFKNAKLSFTLRADDNVQVWLNTQLNPVLNAGTVPMWSPPLSAATDRGFRGGMNCLYVLVEDSTAGAMGFDMAGTVSADGLMPAAAYGVNQTFQYCSCGGQ